MLCGVDGVVHLEAHGDLFHHVNTDATRTLVNEAVRFGVRSFVFLSSAKVMGEETLSGFPWSESDTPNPVNEFGRSKLAAENAIEKAIIESNCMGFCLRSPLVYGPGVNADFRSLIRLAGKGLPLPIGAFPNERSLVSVWNLANAVALAMEQGFSVPLGAGRTGLRTYFVADGSPISTAELYRKIAAAWGKRARVWNVSPGVLSGAANLMGKKAAFQELTGNLAVDFSKISKELGYQPIMTLEQALIRTVQAEAVKAVKKEADA